MKSEYRIGRVWGIPINLHISLFLLMGYLALRSGLSGMKSGGLLGGVISVALILCLGGLFFASIALHELGHSFVAIRKGCRVREITLMFIGGAAKMEQMPRRPADELLMAIAGPAVSIILGATAITASLLIPGGKLFGWLIQLLFYIGSANLVLAGFNLLPAFPMDGGRVFRALLTRRMGRLGATRFAATTGKVVAVLFGAIGVFGIPGVAQVAPGNIALIAIAGFIFFYGEREYRQVQVEELMRERGFDTSPGPRPSAGNTEPPLDDHTVLISPPPYAQGPVRKAEIQRTRPGESNALRDIFGR